MVHTTCMIQNFWQWKSWKGVREGFMTQEAEEEDFSCLESREQKVMMGAASAHGGVRMRR